MYGKNHYNTVISLQLIKINGKNKNKKEMIIQHKLFQKTEEEGGEGLLK